MNTQISVITPTRNKAHTLHRVFNSLENKPTKNLNGLFVMMHLVMKL